MKTWLLSMIAVAHVLTLCWGEMDCWDYLVSGPQGVPDSALSASSYHGFNIQHHNPACGRLYMYEERNSSGCPVPNIGAWCSLRGDPEPHIQVKFSDLKRIVGVVVQQRAHENVLLNDIRTYHVLYSKDGEDWEYVESEGAPQTFYGPTDADGDVERQESISPPVVARYLRIRPLTWVGTSPTPPCLRFDVIGCTHATVPATRMRRFAYLPLPAGSISDGDVITKVHANDLRACSLLCHRDVKWCRSFAYSAAYRQCKAYRVNKYTKLKSGVGEQTISDKQYLYYFDMTHVDLYMTTDPTTGLIYKVITRKYIKQDAMTACADFEMRLLVVNSEDKLNLVQRVKSSSLILKNASMRVNGGWYEVDGVTKWWDGGDPPQPLNDKLAEWDTTKSSNYGSCVGYNRNKLRRNNCEKPTFSICEM